MTIELASHNIYCMLFGTEHNAFRSQNCRSCSMITLESRVPQKPTSLKLGMYLILFQQSSSKHPPVPHLPLPLGSQRRRSTEGLKPTCGVMAPTYGFQNSNLLKMQMENPHVAIKKPADFGTMPSISIIQGVGEGNIREQQK